MLLKQVLHLWGRLTEYSWGETEMFKGNSWWRNAKKNRKLYEWVVFDASWVKITRHPGWTSLNCKADKWDKRNKTIMDTRQVFACLLQKWKYSTATDHLGDAAKHWRS